MKKQSLSLIIFSALFLAILNIPTKTYATEQNNVENETIIEDTDTNHNEANNIKFNPVTVNFILEGIETPLKTPKILNDANDFWCDYTVKLSNQLMYGGIDIQESIRGYYFSHYEIGGMRIESIDAIIEAKNENNIINVVYSEEIPKGGYLRKDFRNGIGLDINYLLSSSKENNPAFTDLYDNRWILELSPELSNELYNNVESFVNANDKTIYFKTSVSAISDKEQEELTKKYGYIESIELKSSLEYDDFKNNYTIKYTLPNEIDEIENLESTLYGINLEGKIEILSTSTFKDNSTAFELNKNSNKYKFLFIGVKETTLNSNENSSTDEESTEEQKTPVAPITEPTDSSLEDTPNLLEHNKEHVLNEASFVILVLGCFAGGSIFTFILALILSIRNENIKRKQEKENNKKPE